MLSLELLKLYLDTGLEIVQYVILLPQQGILQKNRVLIGVLIGVLAIHDLHACETWRICIEMLDEYSTILSLYILLSPCETQAGQKLGAKQGKRLLNQSTLCSKDFLNIYKSFIEIKKKV